MSKLKKKDVPIAPPRDVLRWYRALTGSSKWLIFVLFLVSVVSSLLGAVSPVFYKQIVDAIVWFTGSDRMLLFDQIFGIVVMLVVINFIDVICRRVMDFLGDGANLSMMQAAGTKSFQGLFAHSEQFFADTFVGSLTKKMSKIFWGRLQIWRLFIYDIKGLVLGFVFPLFFIWHESSLLALATLVWGVLYVVMLAVLQQWRSPYRQAESLKDSELSGTLSDVISNHQTVRYFGATSKEFAHRQTALQDRRKVVRKSRFRGNIIWSFDGLVSFVFDSGIVVYAVWLWLQGDITAGVIVMILAYASSISGNLRNVVHILKRRYDVMSDAGEMVAILTQPSDIVDVPHAPALAVPHGEIVFEDVTFSYRKKTVRDGFNLTIAPGERIGVVGLSGAGKSTLIKILLRLYDVQRGRVLIDGQDISQVQQESLRGSVAMVPQDVILFHRTLHGNIAYARPDATREEVIAAAQMAQCHEFIQALPEGYETTVGERGVKLSGGERQRVAIARAILAATKIVILDEATSSLDSQSERLIQEAIHLFLQGKTAIVVAHRLSTIKEMDRIIVMDQGKIVEQGSHNDLIVYGKVYKKLRDLQTLHH